MGCTAEEVMGLPIPREMHTFAVGAAPSVALTSINLQ